MIRHYMCTRAQCTCYCRGGSRISEGGVLTWTFIYVARKLIVDTTSVISMLYLGGLGACPHRKPLQIWPIEIEFGSNFE